MKELIDVVTGQPLPGFEISWPALRYLLEPFSALSIYVLSFVRYIAQLLSWMAWTGLACAACGLAWRYPPGRVLRNAGIGILTVISLALLVLLVPSPAPRLTRPAGWMTIDVHSHTYYSHDGTVSPSQSLWYHRRLGFDRFFITEHGHTGGFPHFPDAVRMNTVMPGMQVSTKERVSLLVLADRPYDGREFRDKTVKEVIDLAHRRGFTVICPHWWKWRYFSWQQLYELGIDGFEVYNAGYRKFTDEERTRLINFCREKGLLVVGNTDWHGWGYLTDVWTALPIDPSSSEQKVAEYLRNRGQASVITYRRPELLTAVRYLFEPWFGLYYYVTNATLPMAAGWAGWLILVLALPRAWRAAALRRAPFALSILFAALTLYYLAVWVPLLPENMVLGRLFAPVLAAISLLWFLAGKRKF